MYLQLISVNQAAEKWAAILENRHFEAFPVLGELASIKIWIPHTQKPLNPDFGASLQKVKFYGLSTSTT